MSWRLFARPTVLSVPLRQFRPRADREGVSARDGLYYCAECNGQFTVTVGTVMERSKIPLSKWLLAMHLMGASEKGIRALQLQRMLGVTYKSAWFMCHRIR
jgi:transposase-like protein